MNDFKKSQRLLTAHDYKHVFDAAQKVSNNHFICLYRLNSFGYARLGLAISKKIIAKSHDRNKIKRLVREAFRNTKTLPAVDIVVLIKMDIANIASYILTNELIQLWATI